MLVKHAIESAPDLVVKSTSTNENAASEKEMFIININVGISGTILDLDLVRELLSHFLMSLSNLRPFRFLCKARTSCAR